jgi:hypothetical protein
MNTTRHGKIARLSKALREELNRRIADGATGRSLVEWLNELPDVQALVEREFGGHPIREQNLSQWKTGGYRDWVHQQEALEFAASLHEDTETLTADESHAPMSEVLAVWLAARYSVATREIAQAKGEKRWKLLRQMCADVTKLRRIDQHNERLALERERVEIKREWLALERERFEAEYQPEPERWWQEWSMKERIDWARRPENLPRVEAEETEEETAGWESLRAQLKRREEDRTSDWSEAERIAWARLPENYRKIYYAGLTPEEQERHMRRILGNETEEDRAYFARVEGQPEPEASNGNEEEKEEDEEEEKEAREAGIKTVTGNADNHPPLDAYFRKDAL